MNVVFRHSSKRPQTRSANGRDRIPVLRAQPCYRSTRIRRPGKWLLEPAFGRHFAEFDARPRQRDICSPATIRRTTDGPRPSQIDRGSTCWTIPFQDLAKFGSRKPGFKLQATDRSAQHLVLLSHVCSCISQTPSIINTDSIGCVIRPAAEVCSAQAMHAIPCSAPMHLLATACEIVSNAPLLCSFGVARNSKAW
jgi:hypothetical protein